MRVRPREAADQAAARGFLARHDSLRVARLGELVNYTSGTTGRPMGVQYTYRGAYLNALNDV